MDVPINHQKAEFNSAFFAARQLSIWLKLYVGLAVLSILLGLFWKQFDLPPSTPAKFSIYFYQYVLGDLDGRPCPSYPVCSVYANEAIAEHGGLIGSWLMLDRLIHETSELQLGTWINWQGEKRLYDPLQRNDFWLEDNQ